MPTLTYYTYNDGNGDPYSGEIVYNPTLNEIWMNYTFLNPGDKLVRFKNYATIGDIAGSSTLLTPGNSFVGFVNQYDSVTDSVIFYTQQGPGNKILKVDATTTTVTPVSPTADIYTAAYNTFATGSNRYYAFPSAGQTVVKVNLSTGAFTTVVAAPPGTETSVSPGIAFSSSTVGWMLGFFADPSKLYKYNLSTGAVSNTYTMAGPLVGQEWVVYCPVNDSIYIAAVDPATTVMVPIPKALIRFDIASTTFSTVWTAPTASHDIWFNSTDAAPILNYDSYRNLIWFDDSTGSGSFGSGGSIVAFDPATDTEKYRFTGVFSTYSTAPWKYAIASDSIWVSENSNSPDVQLLRISFPVTGAIEQPHIWVHTN